MKKLMKAIAFVTVMCLVLSTAAFAAVEVTDYTEKKVAIDVVDVEVGEHVALIITKGDAADYTFDTKTILFVDQKVSPAETAEFEAYITDPSVEIIDVYAGYASNKIDKAVKVGNDIPITQETKLSLVHATVIDDVATEPEYNDETMGKVNPGTKGSLVHLLLNATNIKAGDLTDMWWAFHIKNIETSEEDTRYVKGEYAKLGLGTALQGDVEIAAAFDSTGYQVVGANAIFLLKGEDVHTAEGEKLTEIQGDKIDKN